MELPIFIIIPKINQSISDDAAGDIFYTNNIEFNLCSLCLIFALFGYIAIGNYIVLYSISEIHFMRETVKYDFHMFQFFNFRIFEFIFFRPPIQWDDDNSIFNQIERVISILCRSAKYLQRQNDNIFFVLFWMNEWVGIFVNDNDF